MTTTRSSCLSLFRGRLACRLGPNQYSVLCYELLRPVTITRSYPVPGRDDEFTRIANVDQTARNPEAVWIDYALVLFSFISNMSEVKVIEITVPILEYFDSALAGQLMNRDDSLPSSDNIYGPQDGL